MLSVVLFCAVVPYLAYYVCIAKPKLVSSNVRVVRKLASSEPLLIPEYGSSEPSLYPTLVPYLASAEPAWEGNNKTILYIVIPCIGVPLFLISIGVLFRQCRRKSTKELVNKVFNEEMVDEMIYEEKSPE